MANIADSLAVIKKLVFKDKLVKKENFLKPCEQILKAMNNSDNIVSIGYQNMVMTLPGLMNWEQNG